MFKFFLIAVLLTLGVNQAMAEVLYEIDFTNKKGDAMDWLKQHGINPRKDAADTKPHFGDNGLEFQMEDDILAIFSKKIHVPNAKKIRIHWGVQRYPKGADWGANLKREALAIILFFGQDKQPSGSFIVPNLPYFIGLFLGEKEQEGKVYLGNYYKQGGRYFCISCGQPPGKDIVTEFDFETAFKREFNKDMPWISGWTLEIDLRDTDGKASSYIKKIEFLN